ncbi:MAG: NAD-dependent epimerase/dehydratase family protein [Patescibacteria group bacterium]
MPKTPIFGKKNVLVTGGAGFIGSHLCEVLLKTSKVICLDNFSNSTPANIEHLLKDPDFELLKLNINQPFNLEDFPELEKFKIKFQGVQEIYHMACPTSAKNFNQSKIETLLTNSVGTYYALEMAVKYKAKFMLGSSAVVYGPRQPDKQTFSEEDLGAVNNLSKRACYDEGKRFAETMAATYAQVHKIDTKIARIFRTYGPRLKLFDSQMISDFIVEAIRGQDLVIYGDETFSSSLVYVSDVVDGLLKLMAVADSVGAVNVVNFGDERVHLLSDVAKTIIEKVGSKSKIHFEKPLEFITPLGIPDIRKAKNELGWMPLVMLEDGLKKTIDYTIAKEKTIGQG